MKAPATSMGGVAEPVEVVEYDPRWPEKYQEEKRRILKVAGHLVHAIEHVGSTSVPGIGAKPIIDIMIGVSILALVGKCVRPLEEIGYEYLGENGIPRRHFFRKPSRNTGPRTHHIHMVEFGGHHWERHLLFRDYLRAHPAVAEEYYRLKMEFALQYKTDREAYSEAKTSFTESVVERARRWRALEAMR